MKILTVFLGIVVLLTLTSCGDGFDAEAEKEAVMAVSKELNDAFGNADHLAVLGLLHEDWRGYQDEDDTMTPQVFRGGIPVTNMAWDDYEVLFITPEWAAIRGYMDWVTPGEGEWYVHVTSIYTKVDGDWRLIHSHASAIP